MTAAGYFVDASDRDTTPTSWSRAADQAAAAILRPATIVAGSNGVSVAIRLAVQHPSLVRKLVLLWPARTGDLRLDQQLPAGAAHLVAGDTIRGVADAELGALTLPVAVMASEPENPIHRRSTALRLVTLIPNAVPIEPGFPEPLRPEFRAQLDAFVDALIPHL